MIRLPSKSFPRSKVWLALPLLVLITAACRPPRLLQEAERLLLERDHAAAQGKVDAGLREDPHSRPLWELAIRIQLAQNDVHGAVQRYQQYLEERGPEARMLRFLALSLLRWGLQHRDPVIRLAALQGARKTDSSALAKDVAARLRDPDAVVRTWAAVALSGSPVGADTLGEQLRSPNVQARAIAVRALGRIAQAAALPALLPFVADPAPEVRRALADALALTQTEGALSPLTRLLGDEDNGVRNRATAAIGTLGNAAGAAPLRGLLNDRHLGVRLAALLALSRIDAEGAKPTLRRIATGEELLPALRAGVALAKLGDVQPILNAIARSQVDRNASVRAAGCNAASSIKDRVAPRLVRKSLLDLNPEVRMAAARAMLAHGKRQRAVAAARTLSDQACAATNQAQQLQCLQAAELLARAKHPSGVTLLGRLRAMGTTVPLKLQALTIALRHGGDQNMAISALSDKDPQVTMAAAVWIVRQTR